MWKIRYYSEAVREEIFSLPVRTFAKYEQIIERLEQYGPGIQRMPHMRQLEGELWEIRAIAGNGSARVFYCMVRDDTFLMLHSFLKKTDKTPAKELDKAKRRMKEALR